MKTLKFTTHLVEMILSGKKDSTWRLFDDKDLQEGDEVTFIHKETLKQFGTAVIKSIRVKTLGTLEDSDWVGHERYSSEEEMYSAYRKYYGDRVNKDTEVKILWFDYKPLE